MPVVVKFSLSKLIVPVESDITLLLRLRVSTSRLPNVPRPVVVKLKEPKSKSATPVPVPKVILLAVVSKSTVKFSLLVPPLPPNVNTPLTEERIEPFDVVKAPDADNVVKAPVFGVVEPIVPGTSQVKPPNFFASKAAGTAPSFFLGEKTSS